MTESAISITRIDNEFPCSWVPLQFEPIIGSGERITVAIIYSFNGGKPKCVKILDRSIGALPIKENLDTIDEIVEISMESIDKQITNIEELKFWGPPFEGMMLGNITEALAKNVDELVYQACYQASFLSMGAALKASIDKASGGYEIERFQNYVERHLTEVNPDLGKFFNRKARVGKSRFQTKFNFLNEKICAEFGVVNSFAITYGLTQMKSKMINLEAARIFCEEASPENVKMIVLRPDENVVNVSKRNSVKIYDTLSLLSDLAEKNEIGLVQVYSPYQGAEYLYKVAA